MSGGHYRRFADLVEHIEEFDDQTVVVGTDTSVTDDELQRGRAEFHITVDIPVAINYKADKP